MRLKSIKVSGFKSFADLQSLELKTRLTAIVGPNGCGKSNVIDAVKWVIGESQAKNLRGDQISDVIFGGSYSRKAASQALVELSFDHSEKLLKGPFSHYDEIVVKRMIDREGHSSYWINGLRCRRKDVIDLFMGTGLGPRSYAIIEQGTINRFIDAKSTDLIGYIEEAAGISRYYEKRKETLAHIEESQDNLSRALDLEKELQKRCEVLKQQAEEARSYQAIREKIIQTRQEYFSVAYREVQQVLQTLENKKHQAESALKDHKNVLENLKKGCSRLEKDYQIEQHLFAQMKDDLHASQKQLQDFKNQYEQAQLKLSWVEQSLSSSAQEIGMSARALAALDLKNFAKNTPQAESLSQSLHHEVLEYQKIIEEKKRDYQHAQAQYEEAKKNLQTHKESWTKLQWTIEQQRLGAQQSETMAQQYQQELLVAQQTLDDLLVQSEEQSMASYDEQIASTQASLCEMKNTNKQTQILIQDLKTQFALIKKECEQAASKMSEVSRSLKAHHALKSQWLQSLDDAAVVDSQLWSYDLSYYQSQPTQYLFQGSQPPTQQMLSEIADLDLEYVWKQDSPVYWKQFIPTASIEYALEHADQLPEDKAFLLPGGALVGKGWVRPLRKRATTLADLEQELLSQQQLLSQHQSERDQIETELTAQILSQRTLDQQIDICEHQLKGLETQRHKRQIELSLKHQKILGLEESILKMQNQISHHQQKKMSCLSSLSEYQKQESVLGEQCHFFETQIQDVLSAVDALSEQYHLAQKEYQDLQSRYYQQKSLEDLAKNDYEYALKEYEKEKKKWIQGMASYAKALKEKVFHLQNRDHLQKELEKLEPEIYQHQQDLTQRQKHIEILSSEYRAAEKSLKSEMFTVHTQEDHLRAIQSELEKNLVILENLQEQIFDQGLLIAQLEGIRSSQTPQSLKKNLQSLEKELESLGAVNLKALQDFEIQSQRFVEIQAQRSDLENATRQLQEALLSLNDHMQNLFDHTYQALQKNFSSLFSVLFSGGQGNLEIELNERGERGLVIQAQPPGKKTHRLAMLSGGEKALTAAALVFSFFQLNPAPFCLLDEIDAPLDDANTERLAKLIHQFRNTVQFVIVTHSQVMMSQVESLYGVTMKEPGISRFVSVHLQEALADLLIEEKI